MDGIEMDVDYDKERRKEKEEYEDEKKLLLTTMTNIGFDDDGSYKLDQYALNSIRVIIKLVMKRDPHCEVRQVIGNSNIWETDLIPILKQHSENQDLFRSVIRLMFLLSMPTAEVFRQYYGKEDFPKDAEFLYNYRNVDETLHKYKDLFDDIELWKALKGEFQRVLSTPWEDQSKADSVSVERMLHIMRQILHVPNNENDQNRAPGEDTIHDKVCRSLIESDLGSVLILIASNDDCIQYRPLVMEIIAYMLREQDMKALAQDNTKAATEAVMNELKKDAEKEAMARRLASQVRSSRHSRFGGTFAVINNTGKNIVTNKLYKNVNEVSRDRVKDRTKMKTKKCKGEELYSKRTSSRKTRAVLQKFCDRFLDYGYNSCMASARGQILRDGDSLEENNEVFYFHNMTVFMNYATNRPIWSLSEKIGFISETLSIPALSFIERSMHKFDENIRCDKQRQSKWTTKLNYAIRAFQQIMKTILTMHKSKDESMKQSANQIKEQILYTPEYREIIPLLMKQFKPNFQTKNYLRDLVMAQHWLLKLLDGSKDVVVRAKKKAARKKKKRPQEKPRKPKPITDEAEKDGTWNDIVDDITLARSGDIDVDEVMQYGLLSVEDGSMKALGAIQLALHGRERVRNITSAELSLRLLRAAKHLWPEKVEFGQLENEIETLEILCKERLPAEAFPTEEDESDDEMNGEEAGYDYEEVAEAIIDVEDIVDAYSHPDVLHKAGLLLKDYKMNSVEVNHALCKLIHRVVFQLQRPSMCFQATLFRTFQKINQEKIELKTNPVYKEIWTLGKFILGKFFQCIQENEKLPVELLLWTTQRDWEPIMKGDFGDHFVKRSGVWSEEMDEELRKLAEENRLINETLPPDDQEDLMKFIEQSFSDTSKSSKQLRLRCVKLGLIQNTNKSGPRSSAVVWTEDMADSLTILWREFSEAQDPVSKIQDRLDFTRSEIIKKLLSLELIKDKSEVARKKKSKRGDEEMPEGALDRSSINRAQLFENIPQEDTEVILRRCRWNDKLENALKWLKSELEDEIKDRQDSEHEDWVERSLVPQDPAVAEYLERSHFKSILKSGFFLWPDHQHMYWRIGVNCSLNDLDFYKSCLEDFEPEENQYGSDIDSEPETLQVPAAPQQRNMLSSSDDEINFFKKNLGEASPSPAKEKTKKPRKKRAKIAQRPDSSASENEENEPVLEAESPTKNLKNMSLEEEKDNATVENPAVESPMDSPSQGKKRGLESSDEDEPKEPFPAAKESLNSDSEEESIRPRKRRVILDSDSD